MVLLLLYSVTTVTVTNINTRTTTTITTTTTTTDLTTLTSMIERLEKLNTLVTQKNLNTKNNELKMYEEDVQKIELQLSEIHPEINSIQLELTSQEANKKSIEDNIALRLLKSKIVELTTSLSNNTSSSSSSSDEISMIRRDLLRYQQNLNQHLRNDALLEGRMHEVEKQVNSVLQRLNSRDYKNVNDEYRKCLIDHETVLLATSDLETYYHALDNALLNFHTRRIREVNKVIKELWETIYRGDDIESIEIISGEDGTTSAGTSKAARSYNYRVSMRKGDV